MSQPLFDTPFEWKKQYKFGRKKMIVLDFKNMNLKLKLIDCFWIQDSLPNTHSSRTEYFFFLNAYTIWLYIQTNLTLNFFFIESQSLVCVKLLLDHICNII